MIREEALWLISGNKLYDYIDNPDFLQLERNVWDKVAGAFQVFSYLVLSPRSLLCQAHPSPLLLLIFKPRLDIQSPRWLKFPGSVHSLLVSPMLENELRIPKICVMICTEKLHHSASGIMVNMGSFWGSHISFLEYGHACLFTYTSNFSCVQSGNWAHEANAHHLCGLQRWCSRNLERSVQQHAFLFLCI